MLTLEPQLYLRVSETPKAPPPFPLQSGFNEHSAYRAVGLYNPSETSDAYFIFSNDRDEIWFICNRHVRVVGLMPGETRTRVPLAEAQRAVAVCAPSTTPCTASSHAPAAATGLHIASPPRLSEVTA